MAEVLKLEIRVDDKDGAIKIRQLGGAIDKTADRGEKGFRRVDKSVGGMNRRLGTAGKLMIGFLTGVAAYKLKQMADHFIETASNMDRMQLSLDTITKGHGEEWFERLNEWALKMPVNTQKAIESFSMLRALGIKATEKEMTTLVDTVSALGGESSRLQGIARGLGKIQTKGRVSAEELMILTDNLVPAYEILQEELGLTAEQVSNIGDQGISANVAIQALLDGMDKRFGGLSVKMQTKWSGLTESLSSYRTEFERLTMKSGPMDAMRGGLINIIGLLDEWRENGQLAEWAEMTARSVITAFQGVSWIIKATLEDVLALSMSYAKLMEMANRAQATSGSFKLAAFGIMPDHQDQQEQQKNTAEADAWREVYDERRKALGMVKIQFEEINTKLGEYKNKSTQTAGEVAAGHDKTGDSLEKLKQKLKDLEKQFKEVPKEMTQWESTSAQIATGMQQNFSDLFFKTMKGEWESFEEFGLSVLDTLARSLADMASQQLIQSLFGDQGAGSGGIGGSGGGLLSSVVGIIGQLGEKGLTYEAVFGAKPVYMAKGGIFDRPFAVPMANGGLAIGSEHGQREAIMPLAEMSSGHLGIRASIGPDSGQRGGGDGQGHTTNNYNTYEIKAIDSKSFSETLERNSAAVAKSLGSEVEGGNRDLMRNIKIASK